MKKSSIEEIQKRFDHDVERFFSLETGQSSTMDAPLIMEVLTGAAAHTTSPIDRVLDIGCGAGNNSLKLLRSVPGFSCDLIDLSLPMLQRAQRRLEKENCGKIRVFQGDFRSVDLPENTYDVILAAAVLHHLRDDNDWETVFEKLFILTAPGGSVWISDLVAHEIEGVQELMWRRYEAYLSSLGGQKYMEEVVSYIEKEDSPRSLTYQLNLLQKVGFNDVEVIYKNGCFAAFGARKR